MAERSWDVTPVAGLNAQVGLLLAMLDATTGEWRQELGEVSEEALVWQPVPNGHSIGALLLHIADVEAFWLHEIAGNRARTQEERAQLLSEETQQYEGIWPTPPQQPLAWYYAQLNAIRAQTRQIIAELNDPEHLAQVDDETTTLRWLLFHVIAHEAYHGGQAVLLASLHAAKPA